VTGKNHGQNFNVRFSGFSVIFFSNIERGKMFPKVETLSRLTKSLDVEVFELFRVDLVPEDQKMMNRLSEDIKGRVILALDGIFKQYMG
jgi:transcriptional regulator with XRE-family HTH domain